MKCGHVHILVVLWASVILHAGVYIHVHVPSLVLNARHLGGSAFCNFYRLGVPEHALGVIPLGFVYRR